MEHIHDNKITRMRSQPNMLPPIYTPYHKPNYEMIILILLVWQEQVVTIYHTNGGL